MGALNYQVEQSEYQGDRRGADPGSVSKGISRLLCDEVRALAGPVRRVLNTLGEEADGVPRDPRRPGILPHRGTIRLEEGRYSAAQATRPANRVSWEDAIAFADWAGLRPMTDSSSKKPHAALRRLSSSRVSMGHIVDRRPDAARVAAERRPRIDQQRREARLSADTRVEFRCFLLLGPRFRGQRLGTHSLVGHPAGRPSRDPMATGG